LSSVELMTLKGQCEAVQWKQRTEFQSTFLRVFFSLSKVIELEKQQKNAQMISAHAPEVDIVPLESLRNLGVTLGRRLRGVNQGYEAHSLYDVLTSPGLMNRYAILLLGSLDTTGYGKSQYAKRLAVEWSKAMCRALNLSADRALVVITNTIDAARDIQFKPGMVWLLDEFEVGDPNQIIYVSSNMLKVLFTASEPGSLRCRMTDLVLPAGVARVITANADGPEEWTGSRCAWSPPLERKAIVFQVTKRLCADDWKPSDDQPSATRASAEAIARARETIMNELRALKQSAAPKPVTKGFWSMFSSK
jgi:hypothetical protein